MKAKNIDANESINITQKQYILEAAIEYLEYQYSRGKVKKEDYLERFHELTTQRAKLGIGKSLQIKTPPNPVNGHRAVRLQAGVGVRDSKFISFLGVRPAYHDLEDSNYGFLRGTQIEFLNLLASYRADKMKIEEATIISIVSLAQRSEFFKSFSWRTKIGWDNDYLTTKPTFDFTIGAGYSWGNKLGYLYFLLDPLLYMENQPVSGLGGTVGFKIDKFKNLNTNVEFRQRYYDNGKEQLLINALQGVRISKNSQIVLKYDYKEKFKAKKMRNEQTFRLMFKYYF